MINLTKGLAMVFHKNQKTAQQQGVKFKKSMLAMCIMALSAPSFAQDAQQGSEGNVEEIIVTGNRVNLQNAQDIKRNSDTFVDSISAEDIGSLPDRSVLEAMQRVPGVSIERFAGVDDPDHFSVEGSGAIIRGMTQTRSEFNGRDSFNANSGRGLNFQDVPPELMGGVDIYKNQSADMVEGGIGGTVSLRTRKPFDSDGRVFAISGDMSWGDMAEEWTPTVSALFSDRWETGAGEFGLLLNVADSSLKGTSHGIQSDAYVRYNASDLPGAENFVGTDGKGKVWLPNGSNALMKEDDRDRSGYAVAFQWENPDDTLLGTFQFMRSDATLSWTEHAFKYQGGYFDPGSSAERRFTRPIKLSSDTSDDPATFDFDDRGLFQSGVIADSDGWRSADGNQDHIPRAWGTNAVGLFGYKSQTDTRVNLTNTLVDDYSVNFKWTPNDSWTHTIDLQYVDAKTTNDDMVVHLGVHAIEDYTVKTSTPTLNLVEPWNGLRDADPAAFATGYPGFSGDAAGDSNYFQDPNSYWWRSAMDHFERSEGDSIAFRYDTKYEFEDAGLIKSAQAGVRFAERDQTVRSTSYGWGSLGPEFSGSAPALWLASPAASSQANDYEAVDWGDFYRGDGVFNVPGNALLHAKEELVWDALRERRDLLTSAGGNWYHYADRPDLAPGEKYFAAPDIYNTVETNKAAFVRVDFGSDETAVRFSGNVGLRYVNFERVAKGSIKYPDWVSDFPVPAGLPSSLTPALVQAYAQPLISNGTYANYAAFLDDPANEWASHANNYLSTENQQFGNNGFSIEELTTNYDTWLPSLNIKLELTDDLIARFAASKAIALPDMSDVKNQITLGGQVAGVYPQVDPNNPPPEDAPQPILGAEILDRSNSGGNPAMKPMESNQFDASLEWYFASVGSLTATYFYKDLSNFFVKGAFPRTFTNPDTGVSQTVNVDGTRNFGDGKMNGIELAYQQFFDMLPSPWDGLGIQANYTFIDANGVPNDEIAAEDSDWVGGDNDTGARVSLDDIPLQGQSKETYNIVAMYEKYDWSVRFAYNWRSRYLLTTRDVISKYPLWNDDAGYLDGSVFYNFNENITAGVQLTNILDTQTKTIMILDGKGLEAGRSWFVNDRRVALVLRAKF
jgi:iron complex outermembrane receptor protein